MEDSVDLFKRNKNNSLDTSPASIWATEPIGAVDYNSVIEYLTGLSPEDYTKICQVAAIYRQAEYEACKALGVENEPSTFIVHPEEEDISLPFLEDEPKPRKVAKRNDKKA